MGLKSLGVVDNRATEANVLLLLARNGRTRTLSDAGDLSQALQYAQHSMAFMTKVDLHMVGRPEQ